LVFDIEVLLILLKCDFVVFCGEIVDYREKRRRKGKSRSRIILGPALA
jgi:hypothetical protein